MQETSSEQVEVGATVHGAFDQFEAVHVAPDLAVTPAEEERGEHRVVIPAQARRKGPDLRAFGRGEQASGAVTSCEASICTKAAATRRASCSGGQLAPSAATQACSSGCCGRGLTSAFRRSQATARGDGTGAARRAVPGSDAPCG